MTLELNKRSISEQFRQRLSRALDASGMTQSQLAREIGVDRATISLALNDKGTRLPGAHVVAGAARVLGVSADWLLSLSDRPESAAELMATSLSVAQAERAMIDDRIFEWHQEAAGYKIRHVPAAMPDMLKTEEVLRWEYGPHLGRTTTQAINASRDRLDWMRASASDYEIAMPLYEIDSLAAGEGYYRGLDRAARRAQVDQIIALCDQLYPRLRIYLFDARRLYSSPVTIFGPLLATLYVGGYYLTFRDREKVGVLTQHFDELVRQAEFTARDIPTYLRRIRP